MEDFIKYQSYNVESDFQEVIEILKLNNINYKTEDYPINFIADPSNTSFSHEYVVKLEKESFLKVEEILEDISKNQIQDVEKDYYLFEYSNDELIDIIKHQDEWNKFDVSLAKKILRDRGIEFSKEEITQFKFERIHKLSEAEKGQNMWVILGYIFSIFGGLFGILIGWHLENHKRILPNGEQVFDYSEKDRKHGKRILQIGIVVFTIEIVLRLIEII